MAAATDLVAIFKAWLLLCFCCTLKGLLVETCRPATHQDYCREPPATYPLPTFKAQSSFVACATARLLKPATRSLGYRGCRETPATMLPYFSPSPT